MPSFSSITLIVQKDTGILIKEYFISDVLVVHAVLETYGSSSKQWVEKASVPLWPLYSSQISEGECEPSEYGTES